MNALSIKTDINLFKDETLRTLRDIEKQLLEKLKLKNIETETKIANFDSKLTRFQEYNKRMYESYVQQHVFLEKIKYLNEFKSDTETRLISFDVKLSSFLSDLADIKSRYDKLFLENLTVPGIIGTSCKFASISDYINYNINTSDQLKIDKDFMKKQIKELKSKNEKIEKNLAVSIQNTISKCKLYTDTKFNEIKNFYIQKFNEINEILDNTKIKIEENVLKNEQISNSMKNEIKITKQEITNLIEEKKKENENIKNELKISQNNKKELNDMKKKFSELKANMEKQIINSYKSGKNKNKNNNNYNSNNINNNNLFSDISNNYYTDMKVKNNFGETEHIRITANDIDNDYNSNIDSISNNYNNNYNSTIKNNHTASNIFKSKIENLRENSNKEKGNIKKNINEKNHHKKSGKQIKLKDLKSSKNLKITNDENKEELNPLTIENNQLENKIIIPENLTINRSDSINKYILNNNDKMSRNKTCSNIKDNKNMVEENNNLTNREYNETKKNININMNLNYSSKEKTKIKNIYKKEKVIKNKLVIHSIDGEKALSNLKRKIPGFKNFNNNENFNNTNNKNNNIINENIPIKLIKSKIQNINDSNLNYLKQQSPTLGLYKEFYDKKIKKQNEKEKEKEKEKNINVNVNANNDIILVPKRISPAFGRTAYIEFIKDNNDVNLKNYNANMNINIDNNISEYINKSKYIHTINGNISRLLFLKNKNKKRKTKEDNPINLSV